jgi:hypothetical protein
MSAYASWDRDAAVQRALAHATSSGAAETDGSVWNFAFGSNVNAAKVQSRGMTPSETLRGRLPGWNLVFNHNGGFANIEKQEVLRSGKHDLTRLAQPVPEDTHGVLLRLSQREFAKLAWQEYAYDTVAVDVEVYVEDTSGTQRVQRALAFKTNSCALASTRTLPSTRYIRLIQEGARAASLSAPYCRWLDAIQSDH